MSYSTPALVRVALFPTDDGTSVPNPPSNTAADLSDTQLTDAIAEADATIDSYIGKYYAVPVVGVIAGDDEGDGATVGAIPHPIDYWSRNIAAYSATLTFRKGQDLADTDPVVRRYNATMAALLLVSKGQAGLQIPDNTSPAGQTGAGAPINGYIGDLFDPRDWNLLPLDPDWPLMPNFGIGSNSNW